MPRGLSLLAVYKAYGERESLGCGATRMRFPFMKSRVGWL
ncbi:hypothetical protein HCBG_00812 [Histoplasma capsulatum G186AR]|uniref:Uncharacterized protein n=1 Tax=Ajellomyces capsulatus (strain G186AR / H82 / ATCC MYA-2454 / RMSCC 2432) TaxID=447093 RepID=C0NCG6_AJECG|nr:uncharacterized protein HCBG_00812 [Histoplasma capsulatum G186AR]EEH11357.1 hypothetical protein HCBG_00812 [Histoplasma capsulatum G186AR]